MKHSQVQVDKVALLHINNSVTKGMVNLLKDINGSIIIKPLNNKSPKINHYKTMHPNL